MLTVDPERLALRPGSRVLDLGCGGGRHAYVAWKLGASVVAFDSSIEELENVRGMVGAMCSTGELDVASGGVLAGDAGWLPFRRAAFDVVVASEVLEHIDDDVGAMAELHRVLDPDGLLALSVPRALPEAINWLLSREYHSNVGGHVRIYRRRELVRRLDRAGFRLIASEHRHGLHSPYWWLRCALGVNRPERRLVALYHRLLVWEIERKPRVTRLLGGVLDPLIGKSLVLYLAPVASARYEFGS